MSHIEKSIYVDKALSFAQGLAFRYRHEFITPEHILSALFNQDPFVEAVEECFCHIPVMEEEVDEYLAQKMEQVPENTNYELQFSVQSNLLFQNAYAFVESSNAEVLDIPHVVQAMLLLPESWACYFLKKHLKERIPDFISQLVVIYGDDLSLDENDSEESHGISKNFITCLNEQLENHNPLIGREMELERTIEVLCRKDKNNPLHIGEPGVGKTALAYGLAARIEAGEVPERLKGSRIYELDLGSMLAGTQYRGDFEQRLKSVMKSLSAEKKAILYIDEIHNLIGAGQIGDGSMDASNMLKPYLEQGDIRFIGSTTYEEYNRYFSRSKGMVRRFQQIDIQEPSIDEAIRIIEGLKEKYEEYHHVTYEPGVIEYAVKASARYISDRFLPDKAIDLIDEAGAYREIHPATDGTKTVDRKLVTEVLSRTCKIDANALKEEDNASLEALYERISGQIYGQDEAIRQVVEAVQMAKAGLLDENKPLASLLFVGSTGVGKTEVAKVLASELGIVNAGGNIEMQEWEPSMNALLWAFYGGQEAGTAAGEVLFGKVNPSGKLPMTFEKKWGDNPAYNSYHDPDGDKHVKYTEGIFIGYRGYDKLKRDVQYPFGYGLSYTTFNLSGVSVSKQNTNGSVEVTCKLTNSGKRDGAQVVQAYVGKVGGTIERPEKELKKFEKVFLKAGESKTIKMTLPKDAFTYYSTNAKSFVTDAGTYNIMLGYSSRDIKAVKAIQIQ